MKFPPEVVEAAVTAIVYLKLPLGLAGLQGVTLPPELVAAAEKAMSGRPGPAHLMELWNELRDPRLKECSKLTSARRRAASARLREYPEKDVWEGFIRCVNNNAWCLGEKPSPAWPNWKANFDWFIRPGNVTKYTEGGFSEKPAAPVTARDRYSEELARRNDISKGGK